MDWYLEKGALKITTPDTLSEGKKDTKDFEHYLRLLSTWDSWIGHLEEWTDW